MFRQNFDVLDGRLVLPVSGSRAGRELLLRQRAHVIPNETLLFA
jgi:hypothetical protein